jgi:N-carbamoylputrescine amidase
MTSLRIALLQMTAHGNDQAANLTKGEMFCRRAQALGADVALFPEMWNIGYTFFDTAQPGAQAEWQAQAIGRDNPFVTHFKALALELKLAIAITYLEAWPGLPRNSVTLFDRHGQHVLTYAKVHTCDFDKEAALTPGDEFLVGSLDTAQGEVKVGAMICFDREFPESARVLMLQGAEIILTPNACELEANRLGQFKARAYENMVAMAMTNYATPQENGHSIALDGIAFDEGGSRDMLLVEAGGAEGVYLADLDLAALRKYRAEEGWGNAFRKPRAYSRLTSPEIQPPFVRPEAR